MNLNKPLVLKNTINYGASCSGRNAMGPPVGRPQRRKSVTTSSSATRWGKSQHSILNNSSVNRSSNNTDQSYVENESRTIIALTEGRGDARCEVGIASISLALPTITICQISDTQSYINTMTKINILNPTEIILPATFLQNPNNRLVEKLKLQFPNVKITSEPRRTFNKSNGMDRILQLCLPSVNSICLGLQHKYYALAAVAGLIVYLRDKIGVFYVNESLNVTYQESEGYAIIDVSTADRLELVSCTKPAQASRYSTLFGVLNYTCTKIGARCLRSAILQPPFSIAVIEERLLCVAELIKRSQTHSSIQGILNKVSNIHHLLSITTISTAAPGSCVKPLNYLLLLNELIEQLEPLKSILANCRRPLFKELIITLEDETLTKIKVLIRTMIKPIAFRAKNNESENQRCFAIKPGVNGLLDLVRKTYAERLEDMGEYVKMLSQRHGLDLKLTTNNAKGYHIVFKLNAQQKRVMKKSDLPPEFIQVYRLAGSFTMKTQELINLSARLEDIMVEIVKISNAMISNIITDLKQYIGYFYKLCEDVANLDMIQSLAESSKHNNYVRPKFGEFTELVEARHPMLDFLVDSTISNPISMCKDFNVQVITGPNGAGKSVYIRQVMLLQVMAQVGCYVPAETAMVRPVDRMFARVYLEDNMELGASAFVLEIKEIKYMLTIMTDNSLFIVDELCRNTSVEEGTALAMAICESFCETSAFLLMTTHYTSLTKLYDMYLNMKVWQMQTISSGDSPKDLQLDFRYRLISGVTDLKHYGIFIVRDIWPDSILKRVYNIMKLIKTAKKSPQVVAIEESVRTKYTLESNLRKLKSIGKLSRATVNKYLNEYYIDLENLGIRFNKFFIQEAPQEVGRANDVSQDLDTQDFDTQKPIIDKVIYQSEEQYNNWDAPPNCSYFNEEDERELLMQNAFETSSYRQISHFLAEDSDNINKLIPQISIATASNDVTLPSYGTNNQFVSQNSDNTNDNQVNLESVERYIESCSRSIEEGGDSSQMSFQSARSQHYLSPVVKVIEGYNPPSESSFRTSKTNLNNTRESEVAYEESISYSPLSSPVRNESNKFTTSSSLQFMANKSHDKFPQNLNATSEINLDNLSTKITSEDMSRFASSNVIASTSTSVKESSDSIKGVAKRRARLPKKFVPPKKLTKKEILDDFIEQGKKIFESSDSSSRDEKYRTYVQNRPTIKQAQQLKYLALAKKTEDGVEVMAPKPVLQKPKFRFQRMLSTSDSMIDVKIFSDEKAKNFEESVNSNEQGMKRFKLDVGQQSPFRFAPRSVSDYNNACGTRFQFGDKPETAASSQGSRFFTPCFEEGRQNQLENPFQFHAQRRETSIFESLTDHHEFDL